MEIEKLPSNGDWNIARKQFEDRSDVTHYILGPDDRFRKYPFSEIDHWDRLNDPPRIDRFQRRFKAGEEIEIPQAMPVEAQSLDAKPPDAAPEKISGSTQTQATMLFDRLMDAAMRGDADGMRGISQQYAQTDAAQQWLQQGCEANQVIAEERERQQAQERQRLAQQEREQADRAGPSMMM